MSQNYYKQNRTSFNTLLSNDEPIYDIPNQHKPQQQQKQEKSQQKEEEQKQQHQNIVKSISQDSTKFIKNSNNVISSKSSKITTRLKIVPIPISLPENNEIGSISPVSSISNYLSRKKKLSQSFDKLNTSITLSCTTEKSSLLENEESQIEMTSVKKLNNVEFNESDFLPKQIITKPRIQINEPEKDDQEAPIARHPALVKNNFKSKSMDILNSDSKPVTKPILKQTTNPILLKPDDYDYKNIDQATKLNTYLNGKVNKYTNSSDNLQNKSVVYLKPIKLETTPPIPIIPTISTTPTQVKDVADHNRIKKNNLGGKQLSNSNLYAKCNSRNFPKRVVSPPPPIYIRYIINRQKKY